MIWNFGFLIRPNLCRPPRMRVCYPGLVVRLLSTRTDPHTALPDSGTTSVIMIWTISHQIVVRLSASLYIWFPRFFVQAIVKQQRRVSISRCASFAKHHSDAKHCDIFWRNLSSRAEESVGYFTDRLHHYTCYDGLSRDCEKECRI